MHKKEMQKLIHKKVNPYIKKVKINALKKSIKPIT